MFCRFCGAKNEEDAKYCFQCGEKLSYDIEGNDKESVEEVKEQIKYSENSTRAESNAPVISEKNTLFNGKETKKVAIFGAVIVAVIIAVICIITNAKPTINLNDYLTVSVEGYNGYGEASARVDMDAIMEKYGKKIKFVDGYFDYYGDTPLDYLYDCVDVRLDSYSGLSNGDKISYEWDIDYELYTYLDCNLKYKDGKEKVKGLKKIKTFDPFEELNVIFEGISGEGNVRLEYNGNMSISNYFSVVESDTGLSNWDTITVQFNIYDYNAFGEEFGVVPGETSKKYTVEGLDYYIDSVEDISEEFKSQLQAEMEGLMSDLINSPTKHNSNTLVDYKARKVCEYFGVANEDEWYGSEPDKSVYGIIIEVEYTYNEVGASEVKNETVYYAAQCGNILKSNDGNNMCEEEVSICTGHAGPFIDAFSKIDSIYSEVNEYYDTEWNNDLNEVLDI